MPLPLFTKIKAGLLNVASQYISEGMASALSTLLKYGNVNSDLKVSEINLDDNGLKDESFAMILESIANQSDLQVLNYNNNGLGPKSVAQIEKIFARKTNNEALKEFRISNIKASRQTIQ